MIYLNFARPSFTQHLNYVAAGLSRRSAARDVVCEVNESLECGALVTITRFHSPAALSLISPANRGATDFYF